MKPKAKPASKIPTTQTNTNQKKKVKKGEGLDLSTSLLKKNEFTLIIIGALVVTVLVFFLFFRSPDSGFSNTDSQGGNVISQKMPGDQGLEKRIAALEVSLAKVVSSPSVNDGTEENQVDPKGLVSLEQRVSRMETAMTLKMDSMIGRMEKLEKKIAALKISPSKSVAVKKAPKKVAAVPEKAPVKKKTAQPKKKTSLFHTVKKGETLWSISQKYKTTVAAVRKLNNLTAKDKIYPGNNILVR